TRMRWPWPSSSPCCCFGRKESWVDPWRRNYEKKVAGALIFVFVLLYPLVVSNVYYQRIGVISCIFAILATSLGLLVGQVRLVSAGHAAFFGIGAYTSALLTTKASLPFLVGFAAAIVMSAAIGFLFAIPVLRLKG